MPSVLLPVKHLQQPRDGECLAACAMMVLNYVGVNITYRKLIKTLNIQVGLGTPSFNVHNLQRLGIQVAYRQGNLTLLRQHLQKGQPCIVL